MSTLQPLNPTLTLMPTPALSLVRTLLLPLIKTEYSFGYQTGRRTGLVLWGKLSLSGKGLGQGFLNVAEMMVLVVFLDSIVF